VNATLVVTLIGIVIIGVFGFIGRRGPSKSLSEWTVGGRKFGGITMWFLQAGEAYTTFTFLGLAGLAFSGGVAAFYALPYIPLAFIGLYFIGPLVWRRGRERGHLTQGDFIADFHGSRLLGWVTSVFGVIFLLPYLQLQITGLGLAVQLATGDASSSVLSMVVAFALVVAFVLWAGIHGVATTSYFKDALMIVVLAVLAIVIPVHFTDGIGDAFARVLTEHPAKLFVHEGSNDTAWFFTSMLSSLLGVLFMTLPNTWPMLLSAGSAKALRRNYIYLPFYSIGGVLPIMIGFVALLMLPATSASNAALLTLTRQAFPPWFLGMVVVATAATAMVPAAGLIVAMSSLMSSNIVRVRSERNRFRITQASVVVLTGIALLLALTRPGLLANLLLLTFAGMNQVIPATVLALFTRRMVGARWVLAGLLLGELVVIWLSFAPVAAFGNVNVGLIGLIPNLMVVSIGMALHRAGAREPAVSAAIPDPTR
jgi:solute:Na+ symporter, SSS family